MSFQWTPFHLPLTLSVGLAGLVTALAWRRRDRPGAAPLAVFALAAGGWTLAELAGLSVTGVTAKSFWLTVELTFSAVVPAAWAFIAVEYARGSAYSKRRLLAALAVEPVAFVAVTWSARDLVFSAPARRLTAGGFYVGTETLEPAFTVHVAYSYLLFAVATGVVVLAGFRERELRTQGLTMGLAMGLLFTANAAWLLDVTPPGLDPTNLAFVGSGALLVIGIYRHRILDVVPAMRSTARRQVFEGLPDAVVAVNAGGTVVDVNPATERLFDVDRAEAVGSPLETVFPALTDPGDEITFDRDGERRYFDVRETDPGDAGGNLGRLITLRDVTDRHRTEQRYRTLIAKSLDVVTVLGPDGTITYESPSVETVLGYDPEERVGEDAIEYIHPDDAGEVAAVLSSTTHGEDEQAEFRIRAADGSWRWLEARGRNLIDDPTVGGVVVTSRDVTERKHREQQLNVLYRVLRHNLRNEMTVVLASADGILSQTDDPELADAAETIIGAGERLVSYADHAKTAETVLDRSGEATALALERVARRTVESARKRHPQATVELTVGDSPTVTAQMLIDVALSELLDNAVEHSGREEPSVAVTVDASDGNGTVVVSDDGPGIPDDELAVFASGSESPLEHSSGVGLWLVNWIVDLSGGEISFERTGRGGGDGRSLSDEAPLRSRTEESGHPFETGTSVTVSLPRVAADAE